MDVGIIFAIIGAFVIMYAFWGDYVPQEKAMTESKFRQQGLSSQPVSEKAGMSEATKAGIKAAEQQDVIG